ncbi:MAG: translocation/assembly module TamB domain-containing protein [Candidatus Babeliales bacterium]
MTAFIGGLILSLWMLQTSTAVKTFVGTRLISFLEQSWDAHIKFDDVKVNFFSLNMLFKRGVVKPAHHKEYVWKFDECLVHVSFFDLLMKRKISLHLTFNNIKASTSYHKNGSDLFDHLGNIFATKSSSFEISPQAITINSCDLDVVVRHHALSGLKKCVIHLPGKICFCKNDYIRGAGSVAWHGTVVPGGADVACNERMVIKSADGSFDCYKDPKTNLWHMQTSLRVMFPLLDAQTISTVQAMWHKGLISLAVHNEAHGLNLKLAGTPSTVLTLKGGCDVPSVANVYTWFNGDASKKIACGGQCAIDLTLETERQEYPISGSLIISNLTWDRYACQRIALENITGDMCHLKSSVHIEHSPRVQLSGMIEGDVLKKCGSLTVTNTSSLVLADTGLSWMPTLEPHACSLKCSCNSSGLRGLYNIEFQKSLQGKKRQYHGCLTLHDGELRVKGNILNGNFLMRAAVTPRIFCKELLYRRENKDLVHLVSGKNDPTIIQGFVRWPLIRSFLDLRWRRRLMNSNCVFDLMIDQKNVANSIRGKIRLKSGRFFVPGYYNLINNASIPFIVNFTKKAVLLDHPEILLSKGSVTCPRAVIACEDDWTLKIVHVPLTLNNLLINWGRDFYGVAYGTLLLNKTRASVLKLFGTVVLKRSLLKDTFFAEGESSSLYGPIGGMGMLPPLALDIRVLSEKPVQAKTDTIETKASFDMHIQSAPSSELYAPPSVVGRISLDSGVIKFFRNTLNIERGKIQFLADRTHDPLIDLVAKSRIGKYLITLQLTGSQQKPNVVLEATPDLAEEQIIGLLLSGSEDASLQASLATMVLNNLNVFLFNNVKSSKYGWLDKISKTFKYVQITPNLNDVDGQGKLKGSISVDLGDQLHARLQKSLDFQKDFSAQLEYMLSDDINFKVVRDQGGEMGSEVEMRLKLG